jgi:predicted MPP superfamily phosphohydrolase
MSTSRFAVFLTIVLGIWTVLHLYVFARAGSVPVVTAHLSRRSLLVLGTVLWASYPVARLLQSWGWERLGQLLEFAGAMWIGTLFLLFVALLAVDLISLGGWLLPRLAPSLRAGALGLAGALAVVASVQGLRPPAVRDYTVHLADLPAQHDGLVVVVLTDLHLGTLLGQRWLEAALDQVQRLKPDLVAVVGDLVDGNVRRVEPLVPTLRKLRAPLGVWGVTGNHEFYAGLDASVRLLETAGYRVLRDQWAEVAPGLLIAGVDDLTARRQFGLNDQPVAKALANRPSGAVMLLSHSPLEAETAAAAGASLMLCGHTHAGQIWPFGYLVRLRYKLLAGQTQVNGMPVIVSRGTGTWGPRMRLWRRGEMLRVTLRTAGSVPGQAPDAATGAAAPLAPGTSI